jgi:hypothetical protein
VDALERTPVVKFHVSRLLVDPAFFSVFQEIGAHGLSGAQDMDRLI